MKYIKIFLASTFLLGYLLSIVFVSNGLIGGLTLVMLIPALTGAILLVIENKSIREVFRPFCFKITIKSVIFTILFPLSIILGCSILAIISGQGVLVKNWTEVIKEVIILIPMSIIFFGLGLFEEYGWRGYLLPKLIKLYDVKKANIYMGIIWALFHLPTILLINIHYGFIKALLYTTIQLITIFVFNYGFTYLYLLSPNVILASIMHLLWNNVNVAVLGDSYRSIQGTIIEGNIKIINGECLFGLIIAGLFAIYINYKLKTANCEL